MATAVETGARVVPGQEIVRTETYPRVEHMRGVDIVVLCRLPIPDGTVYTRSETYLLGHHPMLGKLIQGWQGDETLMIERKLVPRHVVFAK